MGNGTCGLETREGAGLVFLLLGTCVGTCVIPVSGNIILRHGGCLNISYHSRKNDLQQGNVIVVHQLNLGDNIQIT